MIRRTFVTFAAALLAVMLLGTNDARAFLIDGFGDNQLNVIKLSGDGTTSTPNEDCDDVVTSGKCDTANDPIAGFVISDTDFGGTVTRTLSAMITNDDSKSGEILSVSIDGGEYTFGMDPGTSGDAWIEWAFGPAVDFTVFATLNVQVDITTADVAGATMLFELCDGAFCEDELSAALTTGVQIVSFDIDTLCTSILAQTGNCNSIDTASLHITGVTNLDIALDLVAIVAEPATLALFGIGLLGLGFLSRRRKRLVA